MTNLVGDSAANFVKSKATKENADWAWEKTK